MRSMYFLSAATKAVMLSALMSCNLAAADGHSYAVIPDVAEPDDPINYETPASWAMEVWIGSEEASTLKSGIVNQNFGDFKVTLSTYEPIPAAELQRLSDAGLTLNEANERWPVYSGEHNLVTSIPLIESTTDVGLPSGTSLREERLVQVGGIIMKRSEVPEGSSFTEIVDPDGANIDSDGSKPASEASVDGMVQVGGVRVDPSEVPEGTSVVGEEDDLPETPIVDEGMVTGDPAPGDE